MRCVALRLVFKVVAGASVLRCSHLNRALCVFPEFIFLNQKVKIRIAENVSSGLLV